MSLNIDLSSIVNIIMQLLPLIIILSILPTLLKAFAPA